MFDLKLHRLNAKLLKDESFWRGKTVYRPKYDRSKLEKTIMQIGTGNFSRAFMAKYIDDLLNKGIYHGGIVAVGTHDPTNARKYQEQDGLYTLVELGWNGDKIFTIIGSIVDSYFIGDSGNWEQAKKDVASENMRLITTTWTEKGYTLDPKTKKLDVKNPLVKEDLTAGTHNTATSKLVKLLFERYKKLSGEITVLCCDNLPSNGKLLEGVVKEMGERWMKNSVVEPEFFRWLDGMVSFPCSTVDRITPATTNSMKENLKAQFGYLDELLTPTEYPFRQFVVQDNFKGKRPPFESVGVTIVDDVTPYEKMKLRVLNATHSTMAYLGHLMDIKYVRDAIKDPLLRRIVEEEMFEEILPVLTAVPGVDLKNYAQTIIKRYENPHMPHTTFQIAMDGSKKNSIRIIPTIIENIEQGRGAPDKLCLAIAGWIRYLMGVNDSGDTYEVQDPMAEKLQGHLRNIEVGNPDTIGDSVRKILTVDLYNKGNIGSKVEGYFRQMIKFGVKETLVRTIQAF